MLCVVGRAGGLTRRAGPSTDHSNPNTNYNVSILFIHKCTISPTLLLSLLPYPCTRDGAKGCESAQEGTRAPCLFCLSIVDLFSLLCTPRDECQSFVYAQVVFLLFFLVCGISAVEFRCHTVLKRYSLTRYPRDRPPSCFTFSHLCLPSSVFLPLGFVSRSRVKRED